MYTSSDWIFRSKAKSENCVTHPTLSNWNPKGHHFVQSQIIDKIILSFFVWRQYNPIQLIFHVFIFHVFIFSVLTFQVLCSRYLVSYLAACLCPSLPHPSPHFFNLLSIFFDIQTKKKRGLWKDIRNVASKLKNTSPSFCCPCISIHLGNRGNHQFSIR